MAGFLSGCTAFSWSFNVFVLAGAEWTDDVGILSTQLTSNTPPRSSRGYQWAQALRRVYWASNKSHEHWASNHSHRHSVHSRTPNKWQSMYEMLCRLGNLPFLQPIVEWLSAHCVGSKSASPWLLCKIAQLVSSANTNLVFVMLLDQYSYCVFPFEKRRAQLCNCLK